MRRTALLATVAACLATVAATGDDSSKAAPDAKRKLVGTWEHERLPDGYRQLKHITPTHFLWVIDNPEKMTPVGTSGGSWLLHGDSSREKIEYASDGWEHLRGKQVRPTSKVDGDRWSVKGTLDTGFVIDETWTRQEP